MPLGAVPSVADYNHRRYHESIHNLTPADVYCGRGQIIMLQRERIKRQTIALRRCSTNGEPRNVINQTSQSLPPFALLAVSKTLMTDTGPGRYYRCGLSKAPCDVPRCGAAGTALIGSIANGLKTEANGH